tara:strand:- start:1858 stop:4299 length:2442 start_codon:yes stop_codon:yes gene_type:complete
MKNIYKHVISVAVFISLTVYLFNPVFFENKGIKQHDIDQWKYSANETIEFRKKNNEEALWSNSMFSGMPAYLIDVKWSNQVVSYMHKIFSLFFPHPVSNIIISFLSFYIMLLCFKVRPEIALFGSIAFTLSSYMIIGISAGHNARIGTAALLPLIIGGVHLCINRNRNLGFIITAVALALQLRLNHLQITYYTLIILIFYGSGYLMYYYSKNKLKYFAKRIGVLVLAATLAVGTFFGEIWAILEYSDVSIRGKSELSSDVTGLEKDYAFQYSNSFFEPLTLFIPNILGGSSRQELKRDSNLGKALRKNNVSTVQINNQLRNVPTYWGDQPLTAPYFAGSICLFLLVLGILTLKKKEKLWILYLLILSMILSMGSNMSFINNLFFDYLPGYNKFRSVTFIILISIFSVVLISSLTLQRVLKDISKHKSNLFKALYVTIGVYIILFLSTFVISFSGAVDSNFQNFPSWFLDALILDRKSLFVSDLIFGSSVTILFFILCLGVFYKKINKNIVFFSLILIIIIDHTRVNNNLLRKDKSCELYGDCTFISKKENELTISESDQFILENNINRKRVFNLQNPFNEAKTSYYHSSVGGYHGAKIRRYQDLIERNIIEERNNLVEKAQNGIRDFSDLNVLNMLNVGYFKFGDTRNNILKNENSNGNAWFVKNIILTNSPLEEINRLHNFNSKNDAIIDRSQFDVNNIQKSYSQDGNINVIEYNPNKIIYDVSNTSDAFIVFSEIYYPHGWKVYVNGEERKILRVNYVLRGLQLNKGNHKIEMVFNPSPYKIGNNIILASNYILLILLVICVFSEIKKTRN